MITCEEPAEASAQDLTPPDQTAEIGMMEVSDNSITFTVTNPNQEPIKISIILDPPAPGAVFMIGTETFAALNGTVLEASAVGNITVTNLSNDTTYTLVITTQDSAGNPHSTPVFATETPRETFPYLCDNGTPPAERSFTENQVKCGTCNAGYDLVTDETTGVVTCAIDSYTCVGGTPAEGRPVAGGQTEMCAECDTGYRIGANDTCLANEYVCENGTPAPGRPAEHHTNRCRTCNDRFNRVDDELTGNHTCVANEYVCNNGAVSFALAPTDGATGCLANTCDSGYRYEHQGLDTAGNRIGMCTINTYTCTNGPDPAPGTGGRAREWCPLV